MRFNVTFYAHSASLVVALWLGNGVPSPHPRVLSRRQGFKLPARYVARYWPIVILRSQRVFIGSDISVGGGLKIYVADECQFSNGELEDTFGI